MNRVNDEAALAAALREAQACRRPYAACLLTGRLAAQTDPGLRAMTDLLLPMVQGRGVRIDRLRDGTVRLHVRIGYREGVRMLDAVAAGDVAALTPREAQALETARRIAGQASGLPDDERAWALFAWLAEHVTYENASPGTAAYPELVGAAGALLKGCANCQGFADAYALLCGLAGIRAVRQCGWSGKGTHLWCLVELAGRWYAVDASRGSRLLRAEGMEAARAAWRMNREGCEALGLRWEPWMEAAAID